MGDTGNGTTTATQPVDHSPAMVKVDGAYLVGEFLGYRQRPDREVNGRTISSVDVGLRIDGGTIETAQFGSMSYAEEAIGAANVGDRVAVRVDNRYGVKDGRAWQFYTGGRSGSSDAFANEFRG